MARALKIAAGVVAVLAAAIWWLLLDGSAPSKVSGEFNLPEYRALVDDGVGAQPSAFHIEIVGTDIAPGIAAQVGDFSRKYHTAFTALQLVWPDKTVVIGGAFDAESAKELAQSKDAATYDHAAYDRLTTAMTQAEQVWITHEHPDHVMAVARHPAPELLAPRLNVTGVQLSALPQFAKDGVLAPEIAGVTPRTIDAPTLIAPGVVAIPVPGHSEGSLCFYVRLETGAEYLLIGDIVWSMRNIEMLKTRPRLLQFMFFDPPEDRKAVLRQVRALHDMAAVAPDLIMLPSHDAPYLKALIANGQLLQGFDIQETLPSSD